MNTERKDPLMNVRMYQENGMTYFSYDEVNLSFNVLYPGTGIDYVDWDTIESEQFRDYRFYSYH